jgi:hypothetical protein
MAPPARRPRTIRADRRRRARHARRIRRLLGGLILAVVVVVTLLVTAFGSGSTGAIRPVAPRNPVVLSHPPLQKLQIASIDGLQGGLRLPIPVASVTAIGYHASGDGALALAPVGRQANQGVFTRVANKLFGDGESGLPYYLLGGADGPGTSALDVGAAKMTDVYSPVDGIVVGLAKYILNGRQFGSRIEIQPAGAPSIVIILSQLWKDPALTVGSAVEAGSSKVGRVADLSGVEKQALARYTQDAGNHVTIQAFAAATQTLR